MREQMHPQILLGSHENALKSLYRLDLHEGPYPLLS